MKDLKSVLEGILGDIDDTIVDSDNAVKQIARTKALEKMNIPNIDHLHRDSRGGLFICWDMPDSIVKMYAPYLEDCIEKMEKNAGHWFKTYILQGACRLRVRCTGKILEFKLVRRESVDGTVFFRLQGKDYYTFGKSNKDTFELMIKMIEQLALHPDILVEMVKNPSTRSKDTQKLYDKLMSAE
jgi:hypothetical protein